MMFSFGGIDHKSFAEQRTRDADGHNFIQQERRLFSRSFFEVAYASEEEILDRAYRTMEAAQLSRQIGGHYKCAYRSAGQLLEALMDRGYTNPRGKTGRVRLTHDFEPPL
jgi:hypothetical protein